MKTFTTVHHILPITQHISYVPMSYVRQHFKYHKVEGEITYRPNNIIFKSLKTNYFQNYRYLDFEILR